MAKARYLLFPWWLAEVGTSAKSFADNPVIGSPALNRLGLHVGRAKWAATIAALRRRRLRHLVSAEDRAAFARDGFVLKRDFLPAEQFAALRAQALAHSAPAREMRQGDTVTRRLAIDDAALATMPALAAMLGGAVWRGLTRYVWSFDADPDVYIQSILSRVHDDEPDPQTALHADTFHSTVKAWLFLTDVAEDEGPFVYVPGSHRMTARRLAWERRRSIAARELDILSSRGSLRIEEGELSRLGLPHPRSFVVPANTLIVADTSGFHARGPSVRPSTRIEIWAFGRRNPFLPWTGLDPFGVPGIAERRVRWMWAVRDRLAGAGLIGQPWRDVGLRTPAEPVS
ncbi:phytanoyl-CoA dioxygenase family protein [Sphingomonas sp.]|uniref:phytanoyl-CoA dioxygenase family protein n=1 Tax=Sphingomonas sp. TaxID=28214 RepID=UPI003B00E714